jgi:hypothetical protein
MILKRFFPFSISEYLKVFGYYVIFIALFYLSFFALSLYSSSNIFPAATTAYAVFLIFLIIGLIVFDFLLWTFTTMLAYATIAKKELSWKLWRRYILSLIILALIFAIPFLFSTRLLSEKIPIATVVFIIIFIVFLHFYNLACLFVAMTGKAFSGIRKGLAFGTLKIKHLIVPYILVLAASVIFSLIMTLVKIDFLNLVLSGVFLSWAALFVCRNLKIKK